MSGERQFVCIDVAPTPMEAAMFHAALSGTGIHYFIEGENASQTTGWAWGAAWGMRLMVEAERAEEAMEVFKRLRSVEERTKGAEEMYSEGAGDAKGQRERYTQRAAEEYDAGLELEEIGRRIRWNCALGVTAPMGVVSGLHYLRRWRRLSVTPRGHFLTIVAIAGCVLQCGVLILVILMVASLF